MKDFSNQDKIELEYNRMGKGAIDSWRTTSSIGRHIGLPDGYYDFGISVGSFFTLPNELEDIVHELEVHAAKDPHLTLVPPGKHHFTFLALAGHKWKSVEELPTELPILRSVVNEHLTSLDWRLSKLRLVPGKNYLLLAGVANTAADNARESFANALLESPWQRHIRERHEYKGYPFPPIIWHTTLCRYQYELFPESIRRLYWSRVELNVPSLLLETPRLRAVTYDWSISIAL
jgi:hypothetical protein